MEVDSVWHQARRLASPNDTQGNDDAARPGRHLIQIEREPCGQQDQLGWNRRTEFPRHLSKYRQIESRKAIGGCQSSQVANHLLCLQHVRSLWIAPQQHESKVSFDGRTDIWWAAWIDGPAPIRQRFFNQLISCFLNLGFAGTSSEVHCEDVLGFQNCVAFQFTAPVAIVVLEPEQVVLSLADGVKNTRLHDIDWRQSLV